MAQQWQPADVEIAKSYLSSGRFASVEAACPEIAAALSKPSLTPSSVLRGFRRAGETNPPSFFLRPPPRDYAVPAGDVRIKPLENLVERYGSAAETRYVRGLERKVGQRDYLALRLEASLLAAFRQCPVDPPRCSVKAKRVDGRRLITALVSDIHFGLNVDPREVPAGGYNWTIAARRMARLAVETAAWKENHREETDLCVVINGDVLAGLIHVDDHGIRPLTEQIHGAFSILFSYLHYLAQHFARMRVVLLPGNHDRVQRERQVAQRWDSHAHAVFLALAAAFRDEKRMVFDVPLTGEGVVDLPSGKAVALYTHGDVKPTISNVGRALSIDPIIAALNRVNASGEYPKPVRIIGWGHYHQGFVLPTGLGTALVNGSVIGPDSFARNACGVRGSEGEPMQLIFESVQEHDFGDSRWLSLRQADNDDSYDKVIATPRLDQWVAA
jgi:hypothetical protein